MTLWPLRTRDTSEAVEVGCPSADGDDEVRVTSSYVPRPSPAENRCHDTDAVEENFAESNGAPFSLATAAIITTK